MVQDAHTRYDRTARRSYEALTSRLDLQVEQVARDAWTVPSKSNPEDFHLVALINGEMVCDCPGAKAGQPCRHVAAVRIARGNVVYRRTVGRQPQSPYPPLRRTALT